MINLRWKLILIPLIFLVGCQSQANPDRGVVEPPLRRLFNKVMTTYTVTADFELDGSGTNIDSIAFWETPNANEMLLFTTAKGNQLVEVWQFPFENNEQPPLTHSSFGSQETQVNGVVIDQDKDLLYVSISRPQSTVSAFTLPDLIFSTQFIEGTFDLEKEPNIALLSHANGETWAYVSSDQIAYVYNALTSDYIDQFQPLKGLETILADDFHQIIYIPDENERTGIYAYHPDGTPYLKDGRNQFGSGVFQSDAEGIALYHCPPTPPDNGSGFIVVADQINSQTEFEFFDRQSWEHLGTLMIDGVSNTDGIASTQQALPGYPLGIFAAINDDTSTVGVGWDKVFKAMGISCDDSLTP